MKDNVENLVQRAQYGDVEAFDKIVELFQDAVFGAACASVQNFHDAEEVAQEAFILAYQELPRLREPAKFPGWLRRITMTSCSRFMRSRKTFHQDLSTAKVQALFSRIWLSALAYWMLIPPGPLQIRNKNRITRTR